MKSRRASPVPLIFLPGTDCLVVPCYSFMQTRVFKSAVRNFLRATATWESSTSLQVWNYSHHEKTTLSSSIFPGGIDFIDRHNSFCWKAGAGANATLEINSPKSRLIQKIGNVSISILSVSFLETPLQRNSNCSMYFCASSNRDRIRAVSISATCKLRIDSSIWADCRRISRSREFSSINVDDFMRLDLG